MKETSMKQQSTKNPNDQAPSYAFPLTPHVSSLTPFSASRLLFRGDKWVRVEAGSEMERRGRAKGWTEFGPGRELEYMNKTRLMEVAENLRLHGHDIEISPRDSKAELIEKIKAATNPETFE